ncbi:hypothetical protein [Pontibacter harenae]|uniref:hypothetical protein n=1 Tax=Pontibacter harenae TaxID=2894083 RepID=UPI001E60EDCC|nr:hypothetical protein [Pontibacter harenae]MCC9166527.1 hypothetical protein [Pontibacter harenae]
MKKLILLLFIVAASTTQYATAQVSSVGSLAIHTANTITSTAIAATAGNHANDNETITKSTVSVTANPPAGKPSLNQLPGIENNLNPHNASLISTLNTITSAKSMTEELEEWVANQVLVQQSISRRKRR